jgi:plasmid stabilization system protein ParE
MSLIYRVEVTDRGARDLDEILGSLWERSPEAARTLAKRFEQMSPGSKECL